MAYDVSKLTKLGALKQMAQRIAADYATKAEVTDAINAKVSSAYTAGGSVAFDDLPGLTEANVGLVVNVTDSFTTTDSFAEGAGKQYPAGTNVAVVKSGEEVKYDALSGFVDLSGYVAKEDGKGLSANDFTDADKAKLNGIEEYVSGAVTRATTTYDDNFARNFGLTVGETESKKIRVNIGGASVGIMVTADTTIQDVIGKINIMVDHPAYYDETSGKIFMPDGSGEPVELVITIDGTDTELTGTPPERVGPMYSFNGRSGMVVPQAGDYTPGMVGVEVSTKAEIKEMIVNATIPVDDDDTFAARYGLSLTDGDEQAEFQISDFPAESLWISANTSLQEIADILNESSGGNYTVTYDETSGLIAAKNGEQLEFAIHKTDTNEELTYTPAERVGLVFGSIATDDEVTEMLTEVFGAAE